VKQLNNVKTSNAFSKKLTMLLSLFLIFMVTISCTSKKGKPAFTFVPQSSVSLNTFQGLTDPNWLSNDGGDLLTKASTISIGGYCSQTAASVVILLDGVDVGSNPNCNVTDRFWTYSGSFTGAEGSHILTIYGKASDGTPLISEAITKGLEKDTTAPVVSSFSFPALDPSTTNSSTTSFTGSVTGGLWTMTANDNQGVFSLSNMASSATSTGNFTFQTAFYNGSETRTITFIAYDKAGNASAPVTRTITFQPSGYTIPATKIAGMGQTAPLTSAGYSLGSSTQAAVGDTSLKISTNASFTLDTDLGSLLVQ
jgi:hypothetical protein